METRTLGRTGLTVGRLGLAASYGVPADAVELAFEQGVNYFFWGSMRRGQFARALRNLSPQRDRWVLVLESYSRMASLIPWSVERALHNLRLDHADILLLGLWNRPVPLRILEACRKLKERGLVRFLGVSTHRRRFVPQVARGSDFDVIHFRYNAVHTGAELDVFPHLPDSNRPGMVSFTATSWGQLLGHRRIPKGEKVPTAGDCYRFVLSSPAVDVCLSGPSNRTQMEHALESIRCGPMSGEELAWMRRIGQFIYKKSRS